MSSLQVALAIVGGLILVAVIIYNGWNTRRNEPRQANPDDPTPASPMADRQRVEPRLDGSALASGDGSDTADPVLMPGDLSGPSKPTESTESTGVLDALIDVIVSIELDGQIVSGEALLAALPTTRRVGSKKLHIEGQPESSSQWQLPQAGGRYHAVQVGVQLANRSGALNEIEYSEFVAKTQHMADAIGGAVNFPDMLPEVARARELDEFANGHDAQLGLVLRARGASWSLGFATQQASKLGFVHATVPGRMVLPADTPGQPPILELGFDPQVAMAEEPATAALREMTLNLDVPQVPRTAEPFQRLRHTAMELAKAMDGVVTDDAGQVLKDSTLESIADDLDKLYQTLEAHDLAAGSAQAQRLFS